MHIHTHTYINLKVNCREDSKLIQKPIHTQVPYNVSRTKTSVRACPQTVLVAASNDLDSRHQLAVIDHDKWMDPLDLR